MAGDSNYNSTILLLHCDGSNGSTTFTDNSVNPKTVTANGNAQISTAQSKFGGASGLFDGTGDYLTIPTSADTTFGTGDFTLEAQIYITSSTLAYPTIFDFTHSGGNLIMRFGDSGFGYKLQIGTTATSASVVYSCSVTQAACLNTWKHVAFTRTAGVCRLFVDGVRQSLNTGANPSTYPLASFTDSISITSTLVELGKSFVGHVDELRVTKGISRYVADFTPQAAVFPNYQDIATKPMALLRPKQVNGNAAIRRAGI